MAEQQNKIVRSLGEGEDVEQSVERHMKGIPLSITAGIGGIVPAMIGHSLSNLPQAVAQFKKSYTQL